MAKNKVSKYSQAIGLNIKKIIQDTNNTQESAANLLNINRATLTNYLNGKRDIPYDILIKVCNSFKTTPNQLFNLQEIPKEPANIDYKLILQLSAYIDRFMKKINGDISEENKITILKKLYERNKNKDLNTETIDTYLQDWKDMNPAFFKKTG